MVPKIPQGHIRSVKTVANGQPTPNATDSSAPFGAGSEPTVGPTAYGGVGRVAVPFDISGTAGGRVAGGTLAWGAKHWPSETWGESGGSLRDAEIARGGIFDSKVVTVFAVKVHFFPCLRAGGLTKEMPGDLM